MRYARLVVLFGASFSCVGINFWLVMTGHYRAPLFVFLGCILITPLILRRLPPVTTDAQQTINNQQRAARRLRRFGFRYVYSLVLGLVFLVLGMFKELPVWIRVLMFCWIGFLAWFCFFVAKRLKHGSRASETLAEAEPKQ